MITSFLRRVLLLFPFLFFLVLPLASAKCETYHYNWGNCDSTPQVCSEVQGACDSNKPCVLEYTCKDLAYNYKFTNTKASILYGNHEFECNENGCDGQQISLSGSIPVPANNQVVKIACWSRMDKSSCFSWAYKSQVYDLNWVQPITTTIPQINDPSQTNFNIPETNQEKKVEKSFFDSLIDLIRSFFNSLFGNTGSLAGKQSGGGGSK
ncbi:hypothetical protein HY498_03225 [Candidatus Woesearchaeota archaeon]|nr:hypothetical protein [Candidatus Woesearchaeota archaeon]MBI4155070.1 hypothetical protein [Candidatus Woesearchaeota archaeon]